MTTIRLDRRSAVGAALAVLAAAGVFALTRPPDEVPILIAASDLPAGVALDQLPLSTRRVTSSEGLVEASTDLTGLALSAPLTAGEPLLHSLLRPGHGTPLPDAMALTLDVGHAAQGALVAGDHVDIYVTRSADGSATTEVVASDVRIIDALAADEGFGAGGEVRLLLAVDDELASAMVSAGRSGEIDVVRVGR